MAPMKMKEEKPEPVPVAWCKKCQIKHQSTKEKYADWGLCDSCSDRQVTAIKAGIWN